MVIERADPAAQIRARDLRQLIPDEPAEESQAAARLADPRLERTGRELRLFACQRSGAGSTDCRICRGRDRPFGRTPAQIPACGTTALGSWLGSNAWLGQSPARRTRSSALGVPGPALCPGHVLLALFPLPSPLSSTTSAAKGHVRRLRRYYGAVRLPMTVHPGRTACAFPERPAPFRAGGQSWDLPVLAHGDSAHAWVLRPRGVPRQLALTLPVMWPA